MPLTSQFAAAEIRAIRAAGATLCIEPEALASLAERLALSLANMGERFTASALVAEYRSATAVYAEG